ncbi:MAG: hypothetical protein U9Q81_03680 [Pseudomonadota bacterium]|nr:hypothetical protein [Pseudomonadota bacterium]
MNKRVDPRLRLLLVLLFAHTSAALAEEQGIPDPLSLGKALEYARQHPRNLPEIHRAGRFPRRQPLHLDCHRLAYASTSGIDTQRNRPMESLTEPVAAQQLEILERFFDVLLADLSFSRYNEAMAVAYIQFDRARARQELGQYSELRVAELQEVYQNSRRRYAASQASQRLTRSLLALAINRPLTLPRDLSPPRLPAQPNQMPTAGNVFDRAAKDNAWLAVLKEGAGAAERRLIDMEVRQQILELLLRLQALRAAQQYAATESARTDLKLEESRTLYEQEVKADLGDSMSQQTKARLQEQQVAYCRALAWAELNALQGKPVWPGTEGEDPP